MTTLHDVDGRRGPGSGSATEVGTASPSATSARAFWVAKPGRGEIRTGVLPEPEADQALVRTLFSGISRGTETLVFRGGVPESQREAMRCPLQEGEFPGPVKYGYIAVGVVESGPKALLGREVFCLHPHQDRFVAPVDMLVPLPAGLPPERAVLAANMETALNVVWDADIRHGDRVAVIGLGIVGLLVARLAARIDGTEVLAIDTDRHRAEAAGSLGLHFATGPPDGARFDRIVHASGHPAGLRTALAVAGFEARVTEASWYGDAEVSLPLGEAFHSRRLTLASSQVGAVAAPRRGQYTLRRRLETALTLLGDPALDALIDGESAFEDLPETMAALAEDRRRAICHRIRYRPDKGSRCSPSQSATTS